MNDIQTKFKHLQTEESKRGGSVMEEKGKSREKKRAFGESNLKKEKDREMETVRGNEFEIEGSLCLSREGGKKAWEGGVEN